VYRAFSAVAWWPYGRMLIIGTLSCTSTFCACCMDLGAGAGACWRSGAVVLQQLELLRHGLVMTVTMTGVHRRLTGY
jgi:hypothetical protein